MKVIYNHSTQKLLMYGQIQTKCGVWWIFQGSGVFFWSVLCVKWLKVSCKLIFLYKIVPVRLNCYRYNSDKRWSRTTAFCTSHDAVAQSGKSGTLVAARNHISSDIFPLQRKNMSQRNSKFRSFCCPKVWNVSHEVTHNKPDFANRVEFVFFSRQKWTLKWLLCCALCA